MDDIANKLTYQVQVVCGVGLSGCEHEVDLTWLVVRAVKLRNIFDVFPF